MLGLGRASQYAGWWGSEIPPVVTFTGAGALGYTNSQSPSFSLLTGASSPIPNWGIMTDGTYDLTDYTSITNFNNKRATIVATLYLTWPTSGIDSGDDVAYDMFNELKQDTTSFYFNPTIALGNSNTELTVSSAFVGLGNVLTLPGSYATYMNRWLTFVWSSSEQQSYAEWASTFGGSDAYCRTAVFDTETGELLGKSDFRNAGTYPDYTTWPDSVSSNNTDTYGLFAGAVGSGGDPQYTARLSNYWASFGTMFDPVLTLETDVNTSWKTTRPGADINGAVAWQNLQLTNSQIDSSNYYVTQSNQDLYSQSLNQAATPSGWSSTDWTAVYSDTITTKDSA